jgi:hypothetical protein
VSLLSYWMSRKPEKDQSLTPIVALFRSIDSKTKGHGGNRKKFKNQ